MVKESPTTGRGGSVTETHQPKGQQKTPALIQPALDERKAYVNEQIIAENSQENNTVVPLGEGNDGASAVTEKAPPRSQPSEPPPLQIGSDVDIAGRVAWKLMRDFGSMPYCEGEFWRYAGTHWEPIPEDEMRRLVHDCDGLPFGNKGERVQLGKGRIDSILHELGAMLNRRDYFERRPLGINCLSGFIEFDKAGPSLSPHHGKHRQRHVLPGRWENDGAKEFPESSLLARLLHGSFQDDPDIDEKIDLLGEIAGAAALGHGPRHIAPKAVILLGRTAENGKSQVLDLLRGLLPPSAVSSVPPSRFGDDRHIVKLVGKLLNTSDELGTAQAIASDRFKAMITGEPLTGRDVYRPAIDFRPQAQHVFACNQFPAFQGGMDRGVLRRLMPITFNRMIPEGERISHIGQRVVAEELDLARLIHEGLGRGGASWFGGLDARGVAASVSPLELVLV